MRSICAASCGNNVRDIKQESRRRTKCIFTLCDSASFICPSGGNGIDVSWLCVLFEDYLPISFVCVVSQAVSDTHFNEFSLFSLEVPLGYAWKQFSSTTAAFRLHVVCVKKKKKLQQEHPECLLMVPDWTSVRWNKFSLIFTDALFGGQTIRCAIETMIQWFLQGNGLSTSAP